jgi:hypothetical protein
MDCLMDSLAGPATCLGHDLSYVICHNDVRTHGGRWRELQGGRSER